MWRQKKRHRNADDAKCDASEPHLKHSKFERPSPMALTSDEVHDAPSSDADECFDKHLGMVDRLLASTSR